jgi:hypothetical protein
MCVSLHYTVIYGKLLKMTVLPMSNFVENLDFMLDCFMKLAKFNFDLHVFCANTSLDLCSIFEIKTDLNF